MATRGKKPFVISDHFRAILRELEQTKQHAFITGRAGTGKSTLLKLYRKSTRKNVAVLAPTGIAALHVQGQTIHSFFRFPPKMLDGEELKKRKRYRIYRNLDAIIIDEVSMVRADLLDNIDTMLRHQRNDDRPFGGVQMLFFGDLFQLPPVVSSKEENYYLGLHYDTPYFFSAKVMEEVDLKFYELHEVYRQSDGGFIRLLENIRTRTWDYDDMLTLNERHLPEGEPDGMFVYLTARNRRAKEINDSKIDQLSKPEKVCTASIKGSFQKSRYPTHPKLRVRKNMQVMFLKNDSEKRFVNGTLGTVVDWKDDKLLIEITDENEDKKVISVKPSQWDIVKYTIDPDNTDQIETNSVGTFKQYPIKPAYAITIHKSQGQTFDQVLLDLGERGAFAHGQTYVALSRCRSLDGLYLRSRLKPDDIQVDPRIVEFHESMRRY